jgi:hypothetical protein
MKEQLMNTQNTEDELASSPNEDVAIDSVNEVQSVDIDSTETEVAQETQADTENTVLPTKTTPLDTDATYPEEISATEPIVINKNDDGPPNKVWMGLVASLILLVGGAAAFLTLNNRKDEQIVTNQEPVVVVEDKVTTLGAEIALTEGVVEISRDGAANWTETPGSESVANLDYIRTKEDSRAIILFDDGSVARLDENTEVYLSSLEREGLELTLVTGQVYTRVVESEELTFTVVTANERFESLGTAFKTATDGTKDTLDVYQSSVNVASENVEITEGNSYNTEDKKQTAIDLDALQDDEFAQWNKEKDTENEQFKDKLGVLAKEVKKETEQESAPSSEQSNVVPKITLSGATDTKGVKLTWTLENVNASNGFKIVRASGDTTPTYSEDEAQYVGAKAREHVWQDENGGSYYYRVCVYRESGACDTYSNAVQLTSPKVEKEVVKSGKVNLSIDESTLSWNLVGGTAPHGFKIVLSEDNNPLYPEDSVLYVGPSATSAVLNEKVAGTYKVRICKYTTLAGEAGCADYSNQVTYTVTN